MPASKTSTKASAVDTVAEAVTPTASVAYEPERLYLITLSRPVMFLGAMLSPMHRNMIQGQHIATLGDAVVDATAL